MMNTEKEIEQKFFPKKISYMQLFAEHKYEEAWKECLSAVDVFPEPKYEQPLMYIWIEDIVRYSIETKQFDIGNKYVPLLMITGQKRCDDGTRECWIGKLAYEQNNFLTAKQFLLIAYEKNKTKHLFKGKENKKYIDFIKEK